MSKNGSEMTSRRSDLTSEKKKFPNASELNPFKNHGKNPRSKHNALPRTGGTQPSEQKSLSDQRHRGQSKEESQSSEQNSSSVNRGYVLSLQSEFRSSNASSNSEVHLSALSSSLWSNDSSTRSKRSPSFKFFPGENNRSKSTSSDPKRHQPSTSSTGTVGSTGNSKKPKRRVQPTVPPSLSKASDTTTSEPEPLHLLTACVYIPHINKRHRHGEDASFILSDSIGVFDGVGSSFDKEAGVDPGKYARKLARDVKKNLNNTKINSLEKAVGTAVSCNKRKGSSTVCLAKLFENKLDIFNLGDSGLLLIPLLGPTFEVRKLQHGFNSPFCVSDDCRDQLKLAVKDQKLLQDGDVIVMATDGLWDNMEMNDIEKIVKKHRKSWPVQPTGDRKPSNDSGHVVRRTLREYNPSYLSRPLGPKMMELARELAITACTLSHSRTVKSPFYREYIKETRSPLGRSYGKKDDITVIISVPVTSYETYSDTLELVYPDCAS